MGNIYLYSTVLYLCIIIPARVRKKNHRRTGIFLVLLVSKFCVDSHQKTITTSTGGLVVK